MYIPVLDELLIYYLLQYYRNFMHIFYAQYYRNFMHIFLGTHWPMAECMPECAKLCQCWWPVPKPGPKHKHKPDPGPDPNPDPVVRNFRVVRMFRTTLVSHKKNRSRPRIFRVRIRAATLRPAISGLSGTSLCIRHLS